MVYDSVADLRAGKITEIPAYPPLYESFPKELFLNVMAGLGVAIVTGVFDLEYETLNKKYPDVKPVKVVELIDQYWKGK